MKITAKTDTSDLRGKLNQYALITGREVSESVRQFARVACVELAHETQPFGNTKQAGEMGETAVARDIHKVYYPATGSKFLRQATRYVEGYNAKTNRSDSANAKFRERMLRYQMEGNDGALARIAGDIGVKDYALDTFDPSRHKQSRDSRGRVRGAKPQLLIGGEAQFEKYVAATQKKVGLTKAGWAKCAEAIPLNRVSSATRGIPQFVTRNKGRASGTIRDQSSSEGNPRVTMTNGTPWCSMVLTPARAFVALGIARNKFAKYLDTAIRKTLREQAKLRAA